jgi:uncharacterized protein YcbK (DUF882 family)
LLERSLSFRHRHTDETLKTTYYADGRYLPGALKEINFLLRDFRNDSIRPIDPQLLDLLYALRVKLETNEHFEIYSAYRSPETNAMLRRTGWGVARNSLHMQGKAVDVSLPGVSARHVTRAALDMQRGGVGSYSGRHFVHLDTGEVRSWRW